MATYLALATANNDRRVLLADLNFDAPAVHKMFEAQPGPGLTECLDDGRAWEEILQPVGVVLVAGLKLCERRRRKRQ